MRPKGTRKGVALVLLLQVICLLLTQARAAWLAFVGSVSLFLLLTTLQRPLRHRLLMLASFWLVSATLFIVLNQFVFSPYTRASQPLPSSQASGAELRAESVNRRFIIWRSTLRLIPERWLLGYGPETFLTTFAAHYPPGSLYDGTDVIIDDPHNLLLEHLFAVGLLGLTTFIIVCARLYAMLFRTFCHNPNKRIQLLAAALLSAASAFLIQAQFNPDVDRADGTLLACLGPQRRLYTFESHHPERSRFASISRLGMREK